MSAQRTQRVRRTKGVVKKSGRPSTDVARRLQTELADLMKLVAGEPALGISAFPTESGLFEWEASISGIAGTPYEGHVYKLRLLFGPQYPLQPPAVEFRTPCFHPNVQENGGGICLDILQDQWTAIYDVRQVLLSIQSLLADPNVDSPLNVTAAALWRDSPEDFARLNAEHYARATQGA